MDTNYAYQLYRATRAYLAKFGFIGEIERIIICYTSQMDFSPLVVENLQYHVST